MADEPGEAPAEETTVRVETAVPAETAVPVELRRLRERIDEIDAAIVSLLDERARIALEVGRVKQETGRRSVRDASREAQVIERVTSASAGLFPEPELVALYRKLIAATRRVQHAQRRAARSPGGEPTPADPGSAGRAEDR